MNGKVLEDQESDGWELGVGSIVMADLAKAESLTCLTLELMYIETSRVGEATHLRR
jgi:hypothetical protein